MHRRLGFVVSLIGMVFVVLPFATLLDQADFVMMTIGMAFVVVGAFFAIESVARQKN